MIAQLLVKRAKGVHPSNKKTTGASQTKAEIDTKKTLRLNTKCVYFSFHVYYLPWCLCLCFFMLPSVHFFFSLLTFVTSMVTKKQKWSKICVKLCNCRHWALCVLTVWSGLITTKPIVKVYLCSAIPAGGLAKTWLLLRIIKNSFSECKQCEISGECGRFYAKWQH